MKCFLTHAALYVKDIEKIRQFYMKYFDGVSNELYQNDKGFSSYFLTFSSGARLEIMIHKDLMVRPDLNIANGYHHLAFSVGSRENVLRLTEQITKDGYTLFSGPRQTGDGYFESCVLDPEGNRIEITE